jgi:tryptophan synthase alpha chain
MSRIDDIFEGKRAAGQRCLMPFVCAGYPGADSTARMLGAMSRAGAAVVEVGFPFSDPIADGATIAGAMHRALAGGSTAGAVFDAVSRYRATEEGDAAGVRDPLARQMLGGGRPRLGLVAMVSVSIVHRQGGEVAFAKRAAEAGFDGLLVPDVPLEESAGLREAAGRAGLSYPMLIAPTTTAKRAEELVKASTGFVYLLARAGITGSRKEPPDIQGRVSRLRQMTDLPVAVGFGISTPEHVRAATASADAAIVGSAIVERVEGAEKQGRSWEEAAEGFVRELVAGLAG